MIRQALYGAFRHSALANIVCCVSFMVKTTGSTWGCAVLICIMDLPKMAVTSLGIITLDLILLNELNRPNALAHVKAYYRTEKGE